MSFSDVRDVPPATPEITPAENPRRGLLRLGVGRAHPWRHRGSDPELGLDMAAARVYRQ